MTWDARQRAMLAEMGFKLPAVAVRATGDGAAADDGADVATLDAAAVDIEVAAPPPPRRAPAPVAAAAPVAVPAAAAALPASSASSAASAFATLDTPALQQAVADCRACGLCQQRRTAVFGDGALAQVQWLVVTDPPDEADDAAGHAVTGDPGRLLDRMLAAIGQRRVGDAQTAFVTPIVKCRPPRGRAPQPAELAACEAVLARQVELLQPRVVLAMGVQAARRLTGLNEPLGKLRGRVHDWRGLPLVVTFPPAYLLRSPADKAGAWDDLRLARQAVPGP